MLPASFDSIPRLQNAVPVLVFLFSRANRSPERSTKSLSTITRSHPTKSPLTRSERCTAIPISNPNPAHSLKNAGSPSTWSAQAPRRSSTPSLALPSGRTTLIEFVAMHHSKFSLATRLMSHVLAIATGRHADAVAKEIGQMLDGRKAGSRCNGL